MSLLSVSNLSIGFDGVGGKKLFENAAFEVNETDKIGLVGDNGTGKTTLFKIITGELAPDSGGVAPMKNLVIGTMAQHVCSDSQRSMWDEVALIFSNVIEIEKELEEINHRLSTDKIGDTKLIDRQLFLTEEFERLGGLTYKSRMAATLIGLGFDEPVFAQRMGTLSGGQQAKVAIARLLLSSSQLLLLDEPTNHLDIKSVGWLEGFLESYNGAVIIVSHDRYFLDKVTNKTFEIANHRVYSSNGNYTAHKEKRKKDREVEEKHFKTVSKEIKRVEETIERFRRFNREKSIKAAENKEKMLERIKAEVVEPEKEALSINFDFSLKMRSGNDVLTTENLAMAFGGNHLFSQVNLEVKLGNRTFILGPNGCGKTTLLKILQGQLSPIEGEVRLGTKVSIGYYDQVQAGLSNHKTVLDEVWDSYPDKIQTEIRSALAAFLFRGEDVFKKIEALSGGERARILLLKLMLAGDNLLLLDEPTNHLDISSREALEDALSGYTGTLIIVSHDRYFINRIATNIAELTQSGCDMYHGNYDDYLEKKEALFKASQGENTSLQSPKPNRAAEPEKKENDYQQKKRHASEIRRLKSQIRNNESLIEDLENGITQLNEQLLLPEISSNHEKTLEIYNAMQEKENALEKAMAEWERLHIEAEKIVEM